MIAPEWYWKGRPEYEASDDEMKYKFPGVLESVMQKDMLALECAAMEYPRRRLNCGKVII